MPSRRGWLSLCLSVAGVLLVLTLGLLWMGVITVPAPAPDSYEHATVTVYDENGTQLGQVDAKIADTYRKRYTGLSDTESLPKNEGMLFTYDSAKNHTYVMRKMDFAIDIIYIGADNRITEIHHAPKPPEGANGNDYRYPGYGQYVLEVNHHWTTERKIEVGDRVRIAES